MKDGWHEHVFYCRATGPMGPSFSVWELWSGGAVTAAVWRRE